MLKFTARGSINNPALLFLHGFLGSHEDWNEVISSLEKNFYCIAVDLPGHGSPLTNNFPQMLEKMLRDQHLETATLVGYSMGGRLALLTTKTLPSLFSHTIAISAHPGLRDEKEQVKRLDDDLKWERLLKTKPLEQFIDAWYEQPLFASLKKRTELFELIRKRRAQHSAPALSAVLHLYGLGLQPPLLHFSRETFFLCGEEDIKYRELYDKIIPQTQLFTLKECGHALHLENPDACAKTIKTILERP
jgi:2-succinyl-6-hydroxy-2,4-cyclohexadiene-1-carboxylate synthase